MERFWNKVDIKSEDECWEWTGAIRSKNCPYGALKYNGSVVLAHRMVIFLERGYWPEEKEFVCHHCDNPKCVNPNHLKVADRSWNMKDSFKKGRTTPPNASDYHFQKGNKPHSTKLTEKEIKEIKRQLKKGNKTHQEISDKYGVCRQAITDINTGTNWSYINI